MSFRRQHIRNTRAVIEAGTPLIGEYPYDTTLKTIRAGDGATLGGTLLAKWGKRFTVSPAQITANQNDYNPTDLAVAEALFINSDAARTITGLQNGATDRSIAIVNIGAFNITLSDANVASTAANRFSFGADLVLRPKQAALLIYSAASARWFLLADGMLWKSVTDVPEDFSLSGDISPAQITANINDYAPTGLATASVLRLSTDASRDLTGITGGRDGRVLTLINIGTNPLVLRDASVASTAANRFSFGADTTLGGGQVALLLYDATTTRWRMIANTAGAAVADNAVTAVKLATSALPQAVGMINGTLVESHAGGAVAFAVKTLAGTDPSAADPVYFIFRNVTAATGNFVVRTVTAALSLTISAGSSLGFTNSTPGNVWIGALDSGASTVELFAVNCRNGNDIYPLGQFPLITTTAEGGAGAADSAATPYSATARGSVPYVVLGYASYQSGLAAAGTWGVSPTWMQLFGHGVKLPGDVVQSVMTSSGALATGTTTIPADDTIPQNTEGDQYLSKAIVPTSTANLLDVAGQLVLQNSAVGILGISLIQGATANSLVANWFQLSASSTITPLPIRHRLLAGSVASTTFALRAGNSVAGTTTLNGSSSARFYGGVMNSYLRIEELQG